MNKKRILLILIICFLFVFIGTLFINIYMVSSTKKWIIDIDKISEVNDADAIIVLGCKVEDDKPSLMLQNRLKKGYDVYNILHTKIILSGSHYDDGYNEVNVMHNYLKKYDIDGKDIYLDYDGFTTYDSIYRAKNVFNAKKVVIVTQEFHIYRALYLASKLDLEAVGVVADDIPQKGIMLKNKIREIFSRDKNFLKAIIKPKSDYVGEIVPSE